MVNGKYLALIGCAMVSCIFAIHYLVAREILDQGVSPYALSAWRGLVGGGLILIFFYKRINIDQTIKNIMPLLSLAFLGFFINQVFFMKGLKLTSSLNVALLSNTLPVISFVFATMTGQEEATRRKLIGVGLSFILVSILVINQGAHTFVEIINKGNFFILLNVLAFCGAFILGKKILNQDFPFELLTGIMLFFGGMYMSILAGSEMVQLFTYANSGLFELGLVIFEILISTSFAYLLNLWTLKQLDVTKVTFFIYLQPIIASTGAFLTKGIVPQSSSLLIFAGIMLSGYLVLKTPASQKQTELA
ncbi:MAG: DMT family transporter [Bacteriovoracaceae bacterium]|nr:DMT family transporter [Bacteriovoracaceae bacterium]